MTSTFFGLETSVRGLMGQQLAIDTTSHNIDNANTPGYSRQRVDLTESLPLSMIPGQLGTGVQIEDVTRLRDTFSDNQYHDQNQLLGQAQVEQDSINKITGIINEPSNTGISTALQNFWNAWDKLGSNASDLSARTEVVQTASTLTEVMNQTSSQLTDLSTNITNSLSTRVDQTNSLLSQVANLNTQISQITSTGETPNDLLDQRDEAVDQLSQLAKVSVTQVGSSYQVSIGDPNTVPPSQFVAVSGATAQNIELSGTTMTIRHFDSSATPPAFDNSIPPVMDTITASGGELQGTLNSITDISNYQGYLNNIAQVLAGTSTDPTIGSMTVTLPGAWTIVGPAGGGAPTYPAGVSGTLADGTTTFASGDTVVSTPGNGITIDASSTPQVATIPAGTSVTVKGLNGLLALGYSQSGSGSANPFFVPSVAGSTITAANITVGVSAPQIAAGTSATVSGGSATAVTGDGTLAIAMSNLKDITTTFPNPTDPTNKMTGTIDNFIQSVVGELGIQGQQENNTVTSQQSLVQQIDNQRQSVAGVSIDEEMANMIRYQQAYNASAKMVSTINDMLTTLMQNV
jgi:flagellar hook-associated protein 1